ncbi:MAG: hypothetical protein J0H66_09710 [Solirubrobacterales bacterium]|nr:hypothetical protein [Solirubrobacterales bacterium]OJU93789.1 MAG: hypothetical protein BGO23_14330 [Solirubrobacterales bacterium 67-14]
MPGEPEKPGLLDRIRDWRLPVRYQVPPRNDLIAFALMALAFGLMVGLAIAPGWGEAGPTGPVIALPAEQPETGSTGPEAVADLQPPAGGGSTAETDSGNDLTASSATNTDGPDLTSTDPRTSSDDEPAQEDDSDTPTKNYAEDPDATDQDDDGSDEQDDSGPALVATVVGADQAGYAVADSAGNLLYVHNPGQATVGPKVGRSVGIDIEPVANGSFVQSGTLVAKGTASKTKLSGVISFIDPDSGVLTISSRGVSVAVAAAAALKKSVAEPQLGAWATAIVSLADAQSASIPDGADETGPDPAEEPIAVPAIAAKSLETTGDPMDEIEVSGPVAWDSTSRTITIGADGFGSLNREISIKVPRKLALKGIKGGLGYAASASISSSGGLSLTGLSANYSLKAAADPKQAFGTHSR